DAATLRALLSDEPSEAEIQEATRSLGARQPEGRAETRPDIRGDTSVTGTRAGSIENHWMLRSGRYFNALALSTDNARQSASQIAELTETTRTLPERQLRDEEQEAARIISES